jgi:hypothetical protein
MNGDRSLTTLPEREALTSDMMTLDAVVAKWAVDDTVAAMMLGWVPPEREWDLLDRGVHAMEARDWPAIVAPISGESLRAPSMAYRLRDLMERHGLPTDQLWLEAAASEDVLASAGVVRGLARRHRVGCGISLNAGFGDRALLPDLAALGISFIVLHPEPDRSVASDLSAMIIGRSLSRRARAYGMTSIGPADLDTDVVLSPAA